MFGPKVVDVLRHVLLVRALGQLEKTKGPGKAACGAPLARGTTKSGGEPGTKYLVAHQQKGRSVAACESWFEFEGRTPLLFRFSDQEESEGAV